MHLVADSGSTKTDWLLVDADGKVLEEYSTPGFNPMFHDENFILPELHKNEGLLRNAEKVDAVYFFGASCSSAERCGIIKECFRHFFTQAEITVGHDMESAAYSVSDGEACIVCILGTGSNSCFFDGKVPIEFVPSLGYILGDEGSGSYLGKRLLSDFLYKRLPTHLHETLEKEHRLSKELIFKNVYIKPNPNVYLASFARFLSENRSEPYVRQLVREGLELFVDLHVCPHPLHTEVSIHFIGSIAYFYEDLLRDVCHKRNMRLGNITRQPVFGLKDFIQKHVIEAKDKFKLTAF